MSESGVLLERASDPRVARLVLNRPARRNAFDGELVAELQHAVRELAGDATTRVIELSGAGKSFCAGADIEWMKKVSGFTMEENRRDSAELASLFRALDELDKPVVARVQGAALGGEQSGHVIMLGHATTGDGMLTGLHLLARVAQSGRPVAELAAAMQRLPQVLVNVSGVDKSRISTSAELAVAVAAAEAELGTTGRVLLRPSGTEPLVRVMVEAAGPEQARDVADRLAEVVRTSLG